ncbi:hypothetical protein RCM47_03180, partial [Escherichia coli]|nr:hypothetical protein [Escherichia coli]
MRKISDITSYVDENNEFTDGDVPAGLRPTPLLALWFNVIQRELVNIVESAGMTLDTADDTQLWQALSGYIDSKNSTLKEDTDTELEGIRTELDTTKETLSSTCVSGVRLGSASSYIPGNESSWTQSLSDGNV